MILCDHCGNEIDDDHFVELRVNKTPIRLAPSYGLIDPTRDEYAGAPTDSRKELGVLVMDIDCFREFFKDTDSGPPVIGLARHKAMTKKREATRKALNKKE